MKLRPYQDKAISDIRLSLREHQAVLLWLPTGGGKTTLTSAMFHSTSQKGNLSYFMCHRRELVRQVARALDQFGLSYGYIAAGFPPNPYAKIQICSVQTVASRVGRLPQPRVCVWDETHHVAAGSWANIFRAWGKGTSHIGLSATPQRLDGKGLGAYYSHMVMGPTVRQLTQMGYLCQVRVFAPTKVDLSTIATRAGDYAKEQLVEMMDKPTITGDLVKNYMQYVNGKRAVVFAISIDHSKHIVADFNASGIPAAHVDGETDPDERQRIIEAFERGEYLVLSNVDLFGEGFDLPAIEACIMARPTKSVGLFLQWIGRAMRPVYAKGMPLDTDEQRLAAIAAGPKPHCYLLDHAGNVMQHGLPIEDRPWSLEGMVKKRGGKKENQGQPLKQCPQCFMSVEAKMMVCEYCGHQWKVEGRKVDNVDGALVEVNEDIVSLQRHQSKLREQHAKTYHDFLAIAKERGYAKPHAWAWFRSGKNKQKKGA